MIIEMCEWGEQYMNRRAFHQKMLNDIKTTGVSTRSIRHYENIITSARLENDDREFDKTAIGRIIKFLERVGFFHISTYKLKSTLSN